MCEVMFDFPFALSGIVRRRQVRFYISDDSEYWCKITLKNERTASPSFDFVEELYSWLSKLDDEHSGDIIAEAYSLFRMIDEASFDDPKTRDEYHRRLMIWSKEAESFRKKTPASEHR